MPRARSHSAGAVVSGIRVTHPQRVLYPVPGLTKLDLVRYYDAVADWMLPHLAGRPLTLKQCAPDVDHCRVLRHAGERAPAQVRVVNIQEQTKIGDYMIVDDRAGLIALAQRNMIEFHTWNATTDDLEHPDRLVFDLDPGPALAWQETVAAARHVREALEALELRSWIKTTGGKGLHLVIPIVPEHDWSACVEFARALASELAARDPQRYTTKFAKSGREKRILIDYLRNNRTATSIAPYSARARETATVSVAIAWDELSAKLKPEKWTIRTLPKRLKEVADPWTGYFRTKQKLGARS